MNKIYPLVFSIIAVSSIANAQVEPSEIEKEKVELVTDRPDQTESPMIVPKNSVQIETGFMYEKDAVSDNEELQGFTYNTTLIRIGLNKHFELRVIQEYLGVNVITTGEETKSNGFSPLSIGAKIKVAKARKFIPETAFLGHLTFPTGTNDFDQTYVSGDFRFSMQWDLSEKFSLGVNLGGETDGETPNMSGLYTFVIGYSPIERLGIFAEAYGFLTQKVENPYDHRLNAGITFLITDLLLYDVSGGFGLSEKSTDYFVSTGLSFRLPR